MTTLIQYSKITFLAISLLLLGACSGSCADKVDADPWDFDEWNDEQSGDVGFYDADHDVEVDVDEDPDTIWDDETFQIIGGPPQTRHVFLGQIDDRRYFWIGHRLDGTAIVKTYTPGEGWELDPALEEVLYDRYPYGFAANTQIVEADGVYFIRGSGQKPLRRSQDHGATWQAVAAQVDSYGIIDVRSDGETLILLKGDFDSRYVYISRDQGQTLEYVDTLGWPNPRHVIGLPGLLAYFSADKSRVSTDGGSTWQEVDDSCVFPPSKQWFLHDDEPYFHRGSDLYRFSVDDGCDRIVVDGYGPHPFDEQRLDLPVSYSVANDHVFGLNFGGWAALGDELTSWNSLPTPQDRMVKALTPLGSNLHRDFIIDLDEEGLALQLPEGLWRTDDEGQSWTDLRTDASTPLGITEFNGDLISIVRRQGGIIRQPLWYHRPVDSPDWEETDITLPDLTASPISAVTRNDELFILSAGLPGVLTISDDNSDFEVLWKADIDTPFSSSPDLPISMAVSIEIYEDNVFVASRRDHNFPTLPPEQINLGLNRVPGVFVSENLDDAEFEPFRSGDGTEEPFGVHDMVIFDDTIWVVTDRAGIWAAPLDTGQWNQQHQNLPTQSGHAPQEAVVGLAALGDDLYAYGMETIYVRESDTWHTVTHEPIPTMSDGFATPPATHGIRNLLEVDGSLLAASWSGLYEVDRNTGEHTRVWHRDGRPTLFAELLPSGLYVGVRNGGVWLYEGD